MSLLGKLAKKILLKKTTRSQKRNELEKTFKKDKKSLSKYKNNKTKLNEDAEVYARRELAKEVGAKSYIEKVKTGIGQSSDEFEKKGSTKGQTSLPPLQRRATSKEGKGHPTFRKMATLAFPTKTLERNLGVPALKNESLSQYAKRIRNRLGASGKKVLDDALKKHKDSKTKFQRISSRKDMGESVVKKALKDSAKRKVTAAVGGGGTTALLLSTRTSSAPEKDKSKKSKNVDQRVNPKDYPKYGKKTLSAKAFRKKYNEAKANKQKTFRFEGRVYIVNAVKNQI